MTLVFEGRFCPEYRAILDRTMTVEGPEGLDATAITMQRPLRRDGREFTRCIGIDFFGIGATTLFDAGQVVTNRAFLAKLNELADRARVLNETGCMVRIRVLLLYPYCVTALNRVAAETTRHRGFIENPRFERFGGGSANFIDAVTDRQLHASNLMRTLRTTVATLRDWRTERSGILTRAPNAITIRFAVINPMFCGLRVNRRFFYDPYTYARQRREVNHVDAGGTPVVCVSTNEPQYPHFCDHFRYLWEHDITLAEHDAMAVDRVEFVPPEKIDFAARVQRIKESIAPSKFGRAREIVDRSRRALRRVCPPLSNINHAQRTFISCGWSGRSDNRRPDEDATAVMGFLSSNEGLADAVEPRMMDVDIGANLHERLFDELSQATLGIIVLSPDIKCDVDGGRYMSRPNVYHEAGFLMGHVEKDLIIFREQTTVMPTNLSNRICIPYVRGKIQLTFWRLIKRLLGDRMISVEEARIACDANLAQLKVDLAAARITAEELEAARENLVRVARFPGADVNDSVC